MREMNFVKMFAINSRPHLDVICLFLPEQMNDKIEQKWTWSLFEWDTNWQNIQPSIWLYFISVMYIIRLLEWKHYGKCSPNYHFVAIYLFRTVKSEHFELIKLNNISLYSIKCELYDQHDWAILTTNDPEVP